MTNPDREELVKLAAELDGWHDCADGDVSAGNGHFRVVCESDSEQQRLNLRATLREVSTALRRLASSDGGVKVRELEWRDDRHARSIVGVYGISAWSNKKFTLTKPPTNYTDGKSFDTLEAAKSAAQADYEARIRSALVEVPAVKGEPEPVAWMAYCPETGGRCLAYTQSRAHDDGREAYSPQREYVVVPLFTAPPASAGMREAFVRVLASLAAAISILERTPKAKKAVASDKMFDTMLDDYRKALEAGRKALTAPGATTKSDGGECACGKFNDGEKCPGDDGRPLCVNPDAPDPSDTIQTDYVVCKGGYFYRPNAQGYTLSIHEAGRWSKAEAEKYATAEGVSAHPFSQFIKPLGSPSDPSSTRSEVTCPHGMPSSRRCSDCNGY